MPRTNPYLLIHSPLDATVKRERKFYVNSLIGKEGICQDFAFDLHLSTLEKLTLTEIDRLLGGSITVDIGYTDNKENRKHRYLNGIVYHLEEIGMSRSPLLPDIWEYRIELGSWFRKLAFVKDCRIFQKNGNTSIQLVSDLLREYELHDFRNEIKEHLPRKDYAVLYNETIKDFISRQLREDAIVWRFEHFENKHVLVFSDDSTAFPVIPIHTGFNCDAVKSIWRQEVFVPLKEQAEAAFDWANPPVKKVIRKVASNKGRLSQYRYTGRFVNREEGEEKVRKQCQAQESIRQSFRGESTIRAFLAGTIFKLHAPTLPDLHGKALLIKELRIEATDRKYTNTFVVQPAKLHYFPPSVTSLQNIPRIMGPQTAIVVGEGDAGQVQTDALGRVKVRFHWDHYSAKDSGNTSAYLRVAMPAAGVDRGFLFNPRIGEEVVVDFEDGNPEKPVIIGSVYSKNNPPPFAPNSKPFCSLIKNSQQADANQVIFDDKPAGENLELVARKKLTITVNHNMKIDVKKNINVKSTAQYIVAKAGVSIKAGNEISNRSLVTILNVAALAHLNSAQGNIVNLAAGIVLQAAGGILSNLAGVLYANTSLLGITQSAEAKLQNESKLLLLNTASNVIHAGDNGVDSLASLAILNKAGTDLVNKGKAKESKITLASSSEAKTFMVNGDSTVGPV